MNILENEARVHSEFLHPGGLAATQMMIEWLAPEPGHRVLEIGCGTATSAVMIAQETGCRVSAVEQLPAMLHAARSRVQRTQTWHLVSLLAANGELPLPFEESSFHAVYAESVLALLNARATLHEIARVLRPGGKFFFNERVWKSETSKQTASEINAKSLQYFGIPAATLEPFDRDDWVHALHWTGFTNIQTDHVKSWLSAQPSHNGQRYLRAFIWRLKRAVQYLYHPQTAIQNFRFQIASQNRQSLWNQLESYLFFAEKPDKTTPSYAIK
jgi:SAM-dependent methyltransferase